MNRDRTWLLLTLSLAVLLISLFLPLVSVETYCENRYLAALYALGAVLVLGGLVWSKATSTVKKAFAVFSVLLCTGALAVNVGFIVYATKVCRHMFDQLH